jgi:Ca2+-binding EF-hand superfamily protein
MSDSPMTTLRRANLRRSLTELPELTKTPSPKSNLGLPGYKAVLMKLPNVLKGYEGATAEEIEVIEPPSRRGSGLYQIKAFQDFNDTPIHLRLRGKFLHPIIDRTATRQVSKNDKLQLAKKSKDKYYKDCIKAGDAGPTLAPGNSANNRSSVKTAYRKFIAQFKQEVAKKNSPAKEVLLDMDEDGNGVLDKREMLLGAHTLGISISPVELEMIWPLLGPFDSSGSIEVGRFLDLITKDGRSDRRINHARDSAMLSLQKINREDRIENKTKLAATLADLTVEVRTKLLKALGDMSLSCEQAFLLLDTDRGGTIDKQEFYRGLFKLGVKISEKELDGIWPLFNLDESGTITTVEWAKFFNNSMAWSYKLLEDKFSHLIQGASSHSDDTTRKTSQPLAVNLKGRKSTTEVIRRARKSKPKKKKSIEERQQEALEKAHVRAGRKVVTLYRRKSVTRGWVVEAGSPSSNKVPATLAQVQARCSAFLSA